MIQTEVICIADTSRVELAQQPEHDKETSQETDLVTTPLTQRCPFNMSGVIHCEVGMRLKKRLYVDDRA
jgi:hypothetical protein